MDDPACSFGFGGFTQFHAVLIVSENLHHAHIKPANSQTQSISKTASSLSKCEKLSYRDKTDGGSRAVLIGGGQRRSTATITTKVDSKDLLVV